MTNLAHDDLAWLPATEQLAALDAREVSSVELVELYLQRIADENPALNAIITLDAEGALAAARNADEVRAKGTDLGALHGLPITVKDSYETAGMRSTCGIPALAGYIPTRDAEPIARLRTAGAIILGKTNMPTGNADVQASNPIFGRANNPWDLTRSPGGSAGGAAAATAAGLASFDYGSEIGGSTRIPASFCGLYGHKVTWRSVPLIGHIVPGPGDPDRWAEPDMACAGMQVRGARDILPALDATVGALRRDGGFTYTLAPPRATKLKDFRVAVWADDPACPTDRDARSALQDAVAALREAGATVTEHPAALPTDLETTHSIFERLVYGALSVDRSTLSPRSVAALTARMVQHPRGDAGKALRGVAQSHRSWLFADAARQQLREEWVSFFEQFDVLLMPVTPTAAPPHHDKDHDRWGRQIEVDGQPRPYWDQVKWSAVANVSGGPATTMPIAVNAAGLPIGVQAMGPAGGDRTTVEFAALLTDVIGGFEIPTRMRTRGADPVAAAQG